MKFVKSKLVQKLFKGRSDCDDDDGDGVVSPVKDRSKNGDAEDVTERTASFSTSEFRETAIPVVAAEYEDKDKKGAGANEGGRRAMFRSEASMVEIMEISRISTYDPEEIVNYWGDSDEHVLRKSELRKAVQEMYFHKRMSDANFTSVGISDKAGEGKKIKKRNRTVSRNAVLDEQDLQYYDDGVVDEELLADVYAITTVAAATSARDKAEELRDSLDEYHNEQ